MQDKWTIEFTSDQILELWPAVDEARNTMHQYPPYEDATPLIRSEYERSLRLLCGMLEILAPIHKQILDELGVPE